MVAEPRGDHARLHGSRATGARRLVVTTIALALLLAAAGAVLAWRNYENAREQEAERIASAADASVGDIGQFVQGRIQILEALSTNEVFVRADVPAIADRLRRLDPAALGIEGGIAWFDARDRVRAAEGAAVGPGETARGPLAGALEDARTQNASSAGPTLVRSLYPEPVFVLVVPTRAPDGGANGTLVGALPLDWLNQVALGRRQLRGGDTLIVDRDGLLIVAPGLRAARDVSGDPVLRRVRADASPGSRGRGIALTDERNVLGMGDRLMGAATDASTTGWTVFVDRSSASAYAGARRALTIEVLALALLVGLGIVAATILGRRVDRGRAAVELAGRRTRQLQRLTASLSAAATPSAVADVVLRAGQEATSADAGSVAVLTPDRSEFVTLGLVGYSDEVTRAFNSYPNTPGLPMPDSLREGPLWLPDATVVRTRYPHLGAFQASMHHQAVATMPLMVAGEPIGGLALSFLDGRTFDDEEKALLLAVADLCAQALDRARLYEAERREAERQHFLAEATTVLAGSLDPREILAALTRTAVPRLAEWCSVSMERSGGIEVVAVAHMDPERVAAAERFARRFPASLGDAQGVGAVIRTGVSQLTPVVTPELIAAIVPPGDRRDAVLELGLSSVMTVPLRARKRTVGALVLASGDPSRRFDGDDLAFVEDLASRAGLAVENAELYDRSRHVARTLQDSLLPSRLPAVPGVDVAARYVAGGEGVEVGGDFYDLFDIDEGETWVAVLGDVCGKGPEAAALTSLARFTIRADALEHPPTEILRRLNRAVIRQVGDSRFLTAACAQLRLGPGGVDGTLARGGHPPAVLARADGSVHVLAPRGPLIGILPDTEFATRDFHLGPGDALVLFSDGVTETRSPRGELFGMDRLVACLARGEPCSAEQLAHAIEDATARFRQGPPRDDVALLVLRALTT